MPPELRRPRLDRRLVLAGGALGSALMGVGSLAYATLPTIPFWLRPFALPAVRALGGARWWGLGLCCAGLTVLTIAWVVLGAGASQGRVDVAQVRRAVVWWVVPLLLAPPTFSDDGWSYAAYGYLTGRGLSPYVVTPAALHGPIVDGVCPCWRTTPAPYGPLPLMWGGAAGRFTADPWALLLAYRLLALIGLGLLMYAAPRLAQLTGRRPAVAVWLATSPFAIAHGIGGVHLDLLLIGLAATALTLVRPGRWLPGAVVVGLATSVKAPAVVAALGVALLALPAGAGGLRRLRTGAAAVGIALATTVLVGTLGGLGVGWLRALHVTLVLRTPLSLTFDVGIWLSELTGHDAAPVVDLVGVGLLALVVAVALWRAPVGNDAAVLAVVGGVLFLTTVLSPVTNYWYFLWCLPLLACCRLSAPLARCVVALTVFLGLVAPLNSSFHIAQAGHLVLLATVLSVVLALVAPRALQARSVHALGRGRRPES